MEKQEIGIKELKEVLAGVFALYEFMKLEAADGLDWGDAGSLAVKLVDDEAFRTKLVDAFTGYEMLDDEIKDLSFLEGVELVQFVLDKLK